MTYRGKHPARVAQVWSVADHKGVRIKLNDGRMFDVLPVSGAPGMPRLGDELATLQADVTGLKVTPYVSNNERVETYDELTGSEQREVTQRGWPRSDFESVVAYARDDAGRLRSWRRFTVAEWGNLAIGSGTVGRMVVKPRVIGATHPQTGDTATVTTTYDANVLATSSRVNRVTAVLDLVQPLDGDDVAGALERLQTKIERNVSNVESATLYAGLAGAARGGHKVPAVCSHDVTMKWNGQTVCVASMSAVCAADVVEAFFREQFNGLVFINWKSHAFDNWTHRVLNMACNQPVTLNFGDETGQASATITALNSRK